METRSTKPRRGAITVMTALIFLALVTCMAVAIDFNRLWTIRNELQTSADAGALAGALQFLNSRDTLQISSNATTYIRKNLTLQDTIHIDSIQKGNWNKTTKTFTNGGAPSNAVNVVVSYLPSRMWMRAFGSAIPRMRARAVAWASAPVATSSGCMKPWAIPYEVLMFAINTQRGIDNTVPANLTRPFDQVLDMAALGQMSQTARTFTLKMGDNGNQNQQQQVNNPAAVLGNMPGNFQAVVLPKWYDHATNSYDNTVQAGGQAYRNNIEGTTCTTLSVGDSLITETGNKVGPTLQAVEPAVCQTVVQNGTNIGDCLDTNGQVGVDIKAAFFSCRTGCNGRTEVEVSMLGSFTLTKIYPRSDKNATPPYDKAQIVGVFKPIQGTGPVGGGSTTHQRVVLAK